MVGIQVFEVQNPSADSIDMVHLPNRKLFFGSPEGIQAVLQGEFSLEAHNTAAGLFAEHRLA